MRSARLLDELPDARGERALELRERELLLAVRDRLANDRPQVGRVHVEEGGLQLRDPRQQPVSLDLRHAGHVRALARENQLLRPGGAPTALVSSAHMVRLGVAALLTAVVVGAVAVADHRHKQSVRADAQLDAYYCRHGRPAACREFDEEAYERRWERRELAYRLSFAVLTGAGLTLVLVAVRRRHVMSR